MREAEERLVASTIPHTVVLALDGDRWVEKLCNDNIKCICGATAKRNRLLARMELRGKYVYLDRDNR